MSCKAFLKLTIQLEKKYTDLNIIITQIYFNSSKYTFPVLALHKDRIGRDMNPSEFVY